MAMTVRCARLGELRCREPNQKRDPGETPGIATKLASRILLHARVVLRFPQTGRNSMSSVNPFEASPPE